MGLFCKKILATLTDEELEKIEKLSAIEQGIKEMQSNLLEEMVGLVETKQLLWKEIKQKYGISGVLNLNRDTGEITKIT